jgi:hypothetical protein
VLRYATAFLAIVYLPGASICLYLLSPPPRLVFVRPPQTTSNHQHLHPLPRNDPPVNPTYKHKMAASIEELDVLVRSFYEGRGEQQKAAQAALNQFKEDPDAWLMVDKILSDAQYPQTKCTLLRLCATFHAVLHFGQLCPLPALRMNEF